MKLLRILLPVLVLGILALAPHQAQAATATFFGPIIPPECHCDTGQVSAPDFGCVLATVENAMNFAISIGVIIFVLVASYAGLLWMFSPMNPHNREMGRGVLMNAVIGLLIALCAWLMVDFIMKTLYNGAFGPWNSILGEGDYCLAVHTPQAGPAQPTGDVTATRGTPSDSRFTYQSGVDSQNGARSQALISLLNCMATKVPGNAGEISALTDRYTGTDSGRIRSCAASGSQGNSNCAHTRYSCHYGGDPRSPNASSCQGRSYAVDFGDQNNAQALIAAANQCGAVRAALENGNHVHVSAANQCGYNENTRAANACQ